MTFTDRVSAYPNRYILTTADGNAAYVILERADEPTVVGTPLNAETFNAMTAAFVPSGGGKINGMDYGPTLPDTAPDGTVFFLILE